MLETPVAFLVFNRPDVTARVFAEIARAKPKRLLVVADGARSENEAEKCAAVQSIIEQVDWDCQVSKNISDVNLGCKVRVASGLQWVFENCEEAIILEDDCLPHPSFFRFCTELLDKYRDDQRIVTISGNNFQFGKKRGEHSYYFSRYPHIWGWATWRRTWENYDAEMARWAQLRDTSWLQNVVEYQPAVNYWKLIFDKTFAGEIDTWDVQFLFHCWQQNGLTILPEVNLVSNIGFGDAATHTKQDINEVANLPVASMNFPLLHAPHINRDKQADDFTFNRIYAREIQSSTVYRRLRRKVSSIGKNLQEMFS
jgi:hypothetical protein